MVCQIAAGLSAKKAAPSSPVASSKNSRPKWHTTRQVAAEIKAFKSNATSAAAGEKTPKTRNSSETIQEYPGASQAVGPVGPWNGDAKPRPSANERATCPVSKPNAQ